MSKNAWAVLAGVIAVGLGSAGCESGPAAPEMKTYVNKVLGFSLSYPGDWTKSENDPGMVVSVIPPDQTDPNVFRDIVFVWVEALQEPLNLEEYAAVKMARGPAKMPDFREFERVSVTLGGQPARRVMYSATMGDQHITSMAYFLLSGNHGYMVVASADSARFAQRRTAFAEIANSFKLPGAAPAGEPPAGK